MTGSSGHTLSLAVLSGKGGVGKTNLALNLAFALHRAGHRVLIVDFDVGLANLDVLLGLAPEKTLQDLLHPGVTAAEVLTPIAPGGFDFLPAASGVPELFNMDEDVKDALFEKLEAVFSDYEFLFLDLGAGINPLILQVAAMAQARLLVVTPEPTSLTDGYAVIKVLSGQHEVSDFFVLVNQSKAPAEGKTAFGRLSMACRKFLDIEPAYFGAVTSDPAVPQAVRDQIPLLRAAPRCKASRDILAVAAKIRRFWSENQDMLRDTPIFKKKSSPAG